MVQMYSFVFLLHVFTFFVFAASTNVEITQSLVGKGQNSSLYENLCQNPTGSLKSEKFTLKNLDESKKWYAVFGDDVARQFFGSQLKGKHLSRNDPKDYEGMCFEGNIPFAIFGKITIGTHNGFGKLNPSVFNCAPNDDLPGSLKCLHFNVQTHFHATSVFRVLDTEVENVYVVVTCFSNNEVGWHTLSTTSTLTKDEYAAVRKRILSLGFDSENIRQMHDEKCSNS